MTLEEVQLKLESGLESSDVTMEGDGCNCSAVIVLSVISFVFVFAAKTAYGFGSCQGRN